MNATTQLGEVTWLKTGIRLRRLSVNAWKFGRRTARPAFSLSALKPCVEILPARIGMAFGSSWRNRDAAHEKANQESRKAGIVVEAFVPNAWRLTETPYSCDSPALWTLQRNNGLADYA